MKNITNLCKKFCEFPPEDFKAQSYKNLKNFRREALQILSQDFYWEQIFC